MRSSPNPDNDLEGLASSSSADFNHFRDPAGGQGKDCDAHRRGYSSQTAPQVNDPERSNMSI
jgi:hypothetical protein